MTEVPIIRTIEDLGLVSHPQRSALSNEMHVRKLPAISAPARLMQILILHNSSRVEREHELIAAFCGKSASDLANQNYFLFRPAGRSFSACRLDQRLVAYASRYGFVAPESRPPEIDGSANPVAASASRGRGRAFRCRDQLLPAQPVGLYPTWHRARDGSVARCRIGGAGADHSDLRQLFSPSFSTTRAVERCAMTGVR